MFCIIISCINSSFIWLSSNLGQKRALVISGVSGAGKSTLSNILIGEFGDDISEVVSHTTRPPRDSELHGVDYHFVSMNVFENMIQDGQFVEYVECFGNCYGTSVSSIANALKTHDTCIMDMEWNGAYKVLHSNFLKDIHCMGILILPPSMRALRERLSNRETETEESLRQRILESFRVDRISKYEHIIVNDDVDRAYAELKAIYLNWIDSPWK